MQESRLCSNAHVLNQESLLKHTAKRRLRTSIQIKLKAENTLTEYLLPSESTARHVRKRGGALSTAGRAAGSFRGTRWWPQREAVPRSGRAPRRAGAAGSSSSAGPGCSERRDSSEGARCEATRPHACGRCGAGRLPAGLCADVRGRRSGAGLPWGGLGAGKQQVGLAGDGPSRGHAPRGSVAGRGGRSAGCGAAAPLRSYPRACAPASHMLTAPAAGAHTPQRCGSGEYGRGNDSPLPAPHPRRGRRRRGSVSGCPAIPRSRPARSGAVRSACPGPAASRGRSAGRNAAAPRGPTGAAAAGLIGAVIWCAADRPAYLKPASVSYSIANWNVRLNKVSYAPFCNCSCEENFSGDWCAWSTLFGALSYARAQWTASNGN